MSIVFNYAFDNETGDLLRVTAELMDDAGNAHIELAGDMQEVDDAEFDKLIKVCPAALYKRDEDGVKSFDYAGCLECGTCRILCGDTILEKWTFPGPTMGVEYREG